jgi:hypothetical protein
MLVGLPDLTIRFDRVFGENCVPKTMGLAQRRATRAGSS